MESDQVKAPTTSPSIDIIPRQAQIQAIGNEINRLIEQSQIEIQRHLLTALARTTDVRYGCLFLVNEKGNPEPGQILMDGHLKEHDEHSKLLFDEQGLTGWAFHQKRGILIADTAADPRWSSWIESFKESSDGSALAVPIQIANRPLSLGAIALIADRPNHFTETDLALITSLADQAAILIENIRLDSLTKQTQNTVEALRQTAHIINSSTNLDQVLYTVLEQLAQAIPYYGAMILLSEDEHLRVVSTAGFTNTDNLTDLILTPTRTPTIFRALRQNRTIVDGDVKEIMDLVPLSLSDSIRSWAIVPLQARESPLGIFLLVSHEPHAYDDQTIPTINAFADHISIAIANHRLAQETDLRLRELAFLHESGQAITSTLNLDHILQLLLERVRDLLEIDAASIALRNEQTGDLVFETASGEGASGVIGKSLKPGQGIAGWVAETGKPLVVPDVYKDARFFAGIDQQIGMKTQAIICVPILLKGHVVGVIEALNPGEVPFDERAVNLLNALAGLAATAIDNARLFAQVRSAEARYEGLFEDSINPIIITDLQGIIVDANRKACNLLEQPKKALRGTNITHLRSAGGNLDFVAPHKQIQSGQEAIFQTDIRSDGQQTTVEIIGKQILVKGTALIQWIGRDISAEIELEQTRDDMVRMIIHDLRNPLSNIMNSLDVMQDVFEEQNGDIMLDELLNIAYRSGQRLHRLINSILDISRLESGRAILETQPTDLKPVLEDAFEFVQPQADIRDIQLVMNLAPNMPMVDIDKDMISRVVLNLLDNAIKFTQINGRVSLTSKVSGDTIEVAVQDNGPGIPEEHLNSVFEKFVRVRRKEKKEGTGLGLAFCQLAIQAHKGRIWVESTPGQGSIFRFILPRSEHDLSNSSN